MLECTSNAVEAMAQAESAVAFLHGPWFWVILGAIGLFAWAALDRRSGGGH